VAYESTLEQWAVGGRHSFKTKYKAPAGSFGENGGFFIFHWVFAKKKQLKKNHCFHRPNQKRKTMGKKDETLDNTVFFVSLFFFDWC